MVIDTKGSWDFFICHVREDKEIARSLAEGLNSKGLKVWYPDYCLKPGDRLAATVDYGLTRSRLGIVILSPEFFKQCWPHEELNNLATHERDGKKVMMPVWHKVGFRDVFDYSPALAATAAIGTSNGMDHTVQRIMDTAKKKRIPDDDDFTSC